MECRYQITKNRTVTNGAYRALSILLTTAFAIACSSSDSAQTPSIPTASSVSGVSVVERLSNDNTSTRTEGWACLSEQGEPLVYVFYREGDVPGLESLRLGMEVSGSVEPADALSKYIWSVTSSTSVVLDDPVSGTQITWENVEFSEDKLLRAFSSDKGQLYCSRENTDEVTQSIRSKLSTFRVDVPPVCITRFEEAGAIPNTIACRELAIVSPAGLGDFFCTGTSGAEIIDSYCGLAPFDESTLDDDEDVNCNQAQSGNPLPSVPSGVDFVFGPGTQFLPSTALSNYSLISAGIAGTNLIASANQAQETGDSGQFFQNVFSLVLPLVPQNSSLGDAFQDFSDFADGDFGSECD